MLQLTHAQVAQIEQAGVQAYPQECCGVLLGDTNGDTRIVREARPLINVAPVGERVGPENRFLIDPDVLRDLLHEERVSGLHVLGFYHSHPDAPARPSATDLACAWPWYITLIVRVTHSAATDLTAWVLNEEENAFAPENWVVI